MRMWLQVPVTRPHCQLRLVQAWVRGGDPPSGASEVGPAPRVTFGARRAAPALSRTRPTGQRRPCWGPHSFQYPGRRYAEYLKMTENLR